MTLVPGDDEEQDPTVLLWLYYFTAQHMLFCNRLREALASVNKAIEHTPTLLELYTLKAKIYQKGGDRQHAAKLFEEARNLDTADRAINAISAMHTLKVGRVEEGTKIMDIFVKDCGYGLDTTRPTHTQLLVTILRVDFEESGFKELGLSQEFQKVLALF